MTTESDGAELVAGEADELLAGVEAAGTDALVAIDVQAVLKREHSAQAMPSASEPLKPIRLPALMPEEKAAKVLRNLHPAGCPMS
ncbi:hypothetical protein [Candidatus Accumulibacter sp. ACC012]|uniref:hypothetical protein n=1 Tax=Candidatus Accumulibacter sp. ACC012 TaxID=2823332 RepID=UPI0025C0D42E|nr:hypothetical protein [Candidatus Accumulibacter sp. ACC012]